MKQNVPVGTCARWIRARARAATACALVSGALCSAGCGTPSDLLNGERIVEVASGRTVTRTELLVAIRASDYALLGEQHDDALHHRRRGELIAALPATAAVIAEQLTRGAPVVFGSDLEASLVHSGFEPKGWGWPLHEPLFAAIARTGLPLRGGNLARDDARRVAREGDAALPAGLAALLAAAPLASAAQAALDADLVQGHCGQLDAQQLPGVRRAQRARDASMLAALRESGGRPAVLVAGNGHVRRDYGVPQLAAGLTPAAKVVSVGFVEAGGDDDRSPYTYRWITPPIAREDPCAGFVMPKPK